MAMNATYLIATRAVFSTILAALLLISGCASGPNAHPSDPLEPFNRSMFALNESVDKAVLKPVAQGYKAVTPYPIRAGINHFYRNIQDAWTALNAVLQLRPRVAAESALRFGINSTLGLGGVLDIASEMGIERHAEDFGKTLGRWGVPAGPYLVFPLFGPSTLRDSTTIVLENKFDQVLSVDDVRLRNSMAGLRLLDTRANLLSAGDLLDEVALDKYSFLRDAYLQKRRAGIYRPDEAQEDASLAPSSPQDGSK